jgi:predicted nucleotidyltransferase
MIFHQGGPGLSGCQGTLRAEMVRGMAASHAEGDRTSERRGLREIPISGMIVPEMGRTPAKRRGGLADALFSPVQQRVLGLLFGQPERRFQSAELIRLAKGGVGAVHRQVARLEETGLVTATRTGNQKHYQARRDSPVFEELHRLVVKTVGVVEPLRQALEAQASTIQAAFVYGSVAKGTDKLRSDIDLMILSDSVSYADVFESLQAAESLLGRAINPTLMTIAQWRTKRARPGSFVGKVAIQPRVFVIGSDRDVG